MKIAAVLFILSVCYIASTEQATAPAGIYTYPSRSWKEMEYKTQQGMEEFKMKAKVFSENAKAAQIPTDPEELRQCASMDCPKLCEYCSDGNTCCYRVMGTCVCVDPKHNCCIMTPDEECLSRKEACILALRQCATKDCETCEPCFVGDTCCDTLFGICICQIPKFGSCCVTDDECLAEKEVCQDALKAEQGH